MFTISISDIIHTGYSSIALFLASCREEAQSVGGGIYRYSYSTPEEIRLIDLPFSYQQLKKAAKKEMLERINQAGLKEFMSLKRKIILDNEFITSSPVYCLEYYAKDGGYTDPSTKQTYLIHKALLFRFIREEEHTS
jgi:hypothetical protein